ncbi:unnamed protein product [Brachionus calyciflorus]|uniref:vitamin-K-epoxide reductase (warfarin-sensitive) n=1 Tax=Brachionus calyciflorus TaxID=104777 RepID=A0A813XEP7_9BILA|nr:unnamed protein product [Brachionus calyciflorus]
MLKKTTLDKESQRDHLKSSKKLELILSFLSTGGILVCLYALQVELFKLRDKNYVAFCDIDGFMSCTKVFTSKYGKGFGLIPEESILNQPNSIYGLVFYVVQLLMLLFRNNLTALKIKLFLSLLSNFGSIYLASILYFVLNDFCIVCSTLYIINALILVFNYKHLNLYYKYQKKHQD